ncbi:hypothetical protein D7I44_05575 [Gryllotalpicola protaetiae]|uniref:Uncharacterized protein n=1 Tax=Gryllotalpicola protaetiae TaxID=2419771 RepID=A0A387BPV8_9MICO|nr:hypothetical protein D7I44_05575 [Gryllotalpicola protaetiae]
MVLIAAAAALAASVTACAGTTPDAGTTNRAASPNPRPSVSTEPKISAPSSSPGIVHVDPTGAPAIVPGMFAAPGATPPADPAALEQAKEWITAATLPPGVESLDVAPAGAPTQPATIVACDWLARATKWWSTDASNAAAAKAWLTAHPITGMALGGTMDGPGAISSISERSPQKPDDSVQFEFAPVADGAVAIRVDVVVVPAGAGCASSG